MEKQVAHMRNKMIALVGLILALATWQRHFVIDGVMAHVEMNMTILSTFAFSIVMAFIFVSKLKNEIIAFNALKEMWDDIRKGPTEEAKDALWRHYRCAQPARVFQRPRLLGHAYDLVTDELARTKKIRLSVETMNTLVHKIDQTIADEKSLIVYLSGLLVFMGLIGTFIGLLHMVGAIGGIIGSLAQSAGGAGAAGAFQELLAALQEPLKGMAAGFASSLFGLFSSLAVGLLGRFAGQAAGVLKHEFEAWLAGVVQIGEEESKQHHVPSHVVTTIQHVPAAETQVADSPAMMRLLGGVLGDYARVASSFDHAARLLQDMRNAQESQAGVGERLIEELGRIQQTQTRLLAEIGEITPIAPALRELGSGLESFGTTVARRIEGEVAGLRDMITDMERTHATTMRMLSTNQLQATTQMAGAIEQLSADIDRRTAAPSTALLEATLERSVRGGLGEVGRALASHSDRLEARATRLSEKQDRIVEEMAKIVADRGREPDIVRLGETIETTLADGFGRISQTMETAFSAYSSLLHVAVSAVEKAGEGEPRATTARSAPEPERTPPQEDAEGHFTREGEELERLLDDFRRRAAAGRQV
jgi:hypothetical protein